MENPTFPLIFIQFTTVTTDKLFIKTVKTTFSILIN